MWDSGQSMWDSASSARSPSRFVSDDVALVVFLLLLLPFLLNKKLFFGKRGRVHRLLGATYVVLFFVRAGTMDDVPFRRTDVDWSTFHLLMDVSLPVMGLLLTLAAAKAFPHKATSEASGTLDATELVSRAEMIEHAFYQGLNVFQILFLNFEPNLPTLLLTTLPWALRARFPVHSFSANYSRTSETTRVYFVKKWQYVFYKHALLHGLNVCCALGITRVNSQDRRFRTYWLALNLSYVMEFFLQTLVRRGRMSQNTMLFMNKFLMLIASVAAIRVLTDVHPLVVAASVALNFTNRGRDVVNVLLTYTVAKIAIAHQIIT